MGGGLHITVEGLLLSFSLGTCSGDQVCLPPYVIPQKCYETNLDVKIKFNKKQPSGFEINMFAN